MRSMQLDGFADASKTGYGAVVYARILHQDATITVTLVAAKARVAPKKSVTMPRLEVLGSLMQSKLLPKIASILQVEEANTYYWIDSQIVLAWIQKDPQQLKTFVQNRVSAIQSATDNSRWNHVRTHQNPADHASRGLSPRQTVQNHLWWKGPPWLMSPPHLWPSSLEQNPISLQQQQQQALRGVQKSPSQDHHPVYGRPPRPQNLPCQAIRLQRHQHQGGLTQL